jgi:hypothetical protein
MSAVATIIGAFIKLRLRQGLQREVREDHHPWNSEEHRFQPKSGTIIDRGGMSPGACRNGKYIFDSPSKVRFRD